MIEKVARAICEHYGDVWGEIPDDGDHLAYTKHGYKQIAKAAIEAMREPSEEMTKAAWGKHYCDDEGALTLYQAMTDAALKNE